MDDPVLLVSDQEPSTSSKYPPSWPPIPDTLLIMISKQNFQGIILRVKNIIHDVRNDPVLYVSNQEPSTSSKYPPSWPPLSDTVIIEISTGNFQGIFHRVKVHHSWCQEHPCLPSLRSGTLNVLQVPPFLTPPSWHTSYWGINTKFSGYLPWGKKNITHDIRNNHVLHVKTSWMILGWQSASHRSSCPPHILLKVSPFFFSFLPL